MLFISMSCRCMIPLKLQSDKHQTNSALFSDKSKIITPNFSVFTSGFGHAAPVTSRARSRAAQPKLGHNLQ